jgi:hypothetical protein
MISQVLYSLKEFYKFLLKDDHEETSVTFAIMEMRKTSNSKFDAVGSKDFYWQRSVDKKQ